MKRKRPSSFQELGTPHHGARKTATRGRDIDKTGNRITFPNMRAVALILLLSTPAAAWEASRDGPVCLLTQTTEDVTVTVSHDITKDVPYAIDLTRTGGWTPGPLFAIRFDGLGPRTITTDRHMVDNDTLTVTDTGFGNVLDGIAQNFVALASTGETAVVIPLEGAAPEVEKFKSCSANVGV
ncbi:MAG: excinuclease ABC subunit B [Pseudomonadota bacterium]